MSENVDIKPIGKKTKAIKKKTEVSKKKYPPVKPYIPINKDKYAGDWSKIKIRSAWERKFIYWCDVNPSVVRYNSEEIKIPYWSNADDRMREYHVDFLVLLRKSDGNLHKVLIEIKPYSQTIMPIRGRKRLQTWMTECYNFQVNTDKWKAARAFAESNGMMFIIMTEFELGISKKPNNIK